VMNRGSTLMNEIVEWIKTHGAAIVALATALGAFVHAVSPEFASVTGDAAGQIFIVISLASTVIHAYAQAAKPPA